MWWPFYLFWLLLVASTIAAWRWGGSPERTVAAMYVAAAVATVLIYRPGLESYVGVAPIAAGIDVALLIGLVAVTIGSNRWWLIVSAALQITTVLGHLAMLTGTTTPFDYFAAISGSSYPSLFALGCGIGAHAWRRRAASIRFGT